MTNNSNGREYHWSPFGTFKDEVDINLISYEFLDLSNTHVFRAQVRMAWNTYDQAIKYYKQANIEINKLRRWQTIYQRRGAVELVNQFETAIVWVKAMRKEFGRK